MKKIYSKYIPEFVLFNSATLRAILEGRLKEYESRSGGWQGPFSIFVTLCATYLVSDFKDRFGVKADQWQILTILSMIVTGIWTVCAWIRLFTRPSLDKFFSDLYNESLTKQSRRIVFIFKAKNKDGVVKILVYRDPVWQCYLLPNVRRSEVPDDDSKLSRILEERFGGGGSNCFMASNIPDCEFVSNKLSQRSGKYTMYAFDFFFVIVRAELGKRFSSASFRVGNGVAYEWLSLDELYADQMTIARNRDVLDFLSENSADLLGNSIPLSVTDPIEIR